MSLEINNLLEGFLIFLFFIIISGCIGEPFPNETDENRLSVEEVCKDTEKISPALKLGCIRIVAQYNNSVQECELIQENPQYADAALFKQSCKQTISNGTMVFKHGRINSFEGRAYVNNVENPSLVRECQTTCQDEGMRYIENEEAFDIQSAYNIYLVNIDFSELATTNTATHIFTCHCFET